MSEADADLYIAVDLSGVDLSNDEAIDTFALTLWEALRQQAVPPVGRATIARSE